MGVQTSFVRSVNLDSWTEKQLSLMTLGGNKKFKEFLKNYDLNEEVPGIRICTRAADFYRRKLNAKCNGNMFDEVPPTYDHGREKAPI
jgi:ADP-ribosylation factor GTPase-activating protein 2/3